MTKAELIIELKNARESLHSLRDLESAMKRMNDTKLQLRVDKSFLDREISAAKRAIDDFKRGADKPVTLTVDGVPRMISSLGAAREVLEELTGKKHDIQLDIADTNLVKSHLQETKRDLQEVTASAAELVSTLGNVFDALSRVSSATASFASGIGNSFSQMAGMFGSDVLTTAGNTLTYMATKGLVGDFSKIVSRYDIMSTFTKYMEAAGVASDKSADALQRVNDAILGLPIGLDEAADRLRRYQMFLGDVNDATNLTIGLQNAVMAGGAGAYSKTQAYQQIERLLVAGKLNTSRQWAALFQGLGVSLQYVAEEMGVSGMSARQLADGLMSGKIPAQDLLRALMRLGEGTSDTAQKLSGLLDIYKGTLESWISNIKFAAVRGGETVLKSLNEGLLDATDKGLVGYLKDVRDAMNAFYKGTGGFITGNPALLRANIDAVQGLFDALGRFSASDIGTMIFENLARAVDMLTQALNRLPTDEVEEFIAFAVTLAGPIGKLFSLVSAGAPIMIAVFERFKDFDFEHLLDRIIEEVGRLATIIERLLSLLSDEQLTELLTFGLVYGAPAAKGFSMVADALKEVATVMALLGGKGAIAWLGERVLWLASTFDELLGSISAVAGGLGGVLGAIGIGAAVALPLAHADKVRLDNRRKELGVDKMSADELRARIAGLKGSDQLQDVLVGTDAARQANDDLRIYEDALKDIGQTAPLTAAAIEEVAEATNNAAAANIEAADTTQTLASRMNELRENYALTRTEAEKLAEKQVDLFAETEMAATVGIDSLKGYLAQNNTVLDDYQKYAEKAAQIIIANPQYGDAISGMFQKLAEGGLEGAGEIRGLVDAFETNTDEFFTYVEEYIKTKENEGSYIDWQAILLGGYSPDDMALVLADQFGMTISKAIEYLDQQTALSTEGARLEKFALLNPESMMESSGLSDFGTRIGEQLSEGVEEAVKAIGGLKESFNTLANEDDGALTQFNALATVVNEETLPATVESFAQLSEDTVPVTISAFEGLIRVIEDLVSVLDELIDALGEADTATNDLRGSVDDLAGTMGAAIGDVAALAGSMLEFAASVGEAIDAVAELASAISNIPSVSVGAPTVSGGPVKPMYKASGGFIPRGTDTVPAMLTPGEFVMKRSAVNRFGVGVMAALNNLDIGAAIEAMYRRVPQLPSLMPMQYNVSYDRSDNRNISIHQDIHTNNPAFTYRMASRWAHAL